MGWGDEIIASGQARLLFEKHAQKVQIVDRYGNRRHHDAWLHSPYIQQPYESFEPSPKLKNCPGHRPYITTKTPDQWNWIDWECPVGNIFFSAQERAFARTINPGVIIEPNNKAKASPNKDWGFSRWVELSRLLKAEGLPVSQLGPVGTRTIPGVRLIETPTIRLACAVLARAQAAVLPEGGLHHSAAALGIRSVVIYGGFISPKQTGYSMHANLFTAEKACGKRIACAHCATALALITPALVLEKLKEIIDGNP